MTAHVSRPLLWLTFGLLALAIPTAGMAEADEPAPVVRAVLFYVPDCSACQDLFDYLLPALFERYGQRMEIAAFDASQPEGRGLYLAAARYGLSADLPALLVGAKPFAGLDGIGASFGDGFESLAADPTASRWPDRPGLQALLPRGVATVRERTAAAPEITLPESRPREPTHRDRIANALAVGVLVAMVLALFHSLVRLRRLTVTSRRHALPIPVALLVGLGISGYTAYTSLADVLPMCGPIGSCDVVQHSEYAKLFGVPMGVLGVLGYAAILVTWSVARRLSPRGGGWRWLPWTIALLAVLFSLRLTALEPFVIGATCLWCLGSAVTITLVLWLLSGETRGCSTRPP